MNIKLQNVHIFLSVLLISMAGLTVQAQNVGDKFEYEGLYYEIYSENEVYVVKPESEWNEENTPTGEITIPEMVNYNETDYTVTGIKQATFTSCNALTGVVMPNSITIIEEMAFQFCEALINVTFSNTLEKIKGGAFRYCTSLNSADIPNSLTVLGGGVFYGCSSLSSVTLPDNITSIKNSTFQGCSSLSFITLPNSIKFIEKYAFKECSALSTITIPSNVEEIGEMAFSNCNALVSIVSEVESVDNILMGNDVFQGVDKVSCYLYVPEGKEQEYANAEQWGQFTHIGGILGEFEVNNLYYKPITDTTVELFQNPYSEYGELTGSITIPEQVTYENHTYTVVKIGKSALKSETFIDTIILPNTITEIDDEAFFWCLDLKSINIPNSVERIGSKAFSSCYDLETITIPNSVTYIGFSAFSTCGFTSLISLIEDVNSVMLESEVFSEIDKDSCVLKVPMGKIPDYQSAAQWQDFLNIEEYDNTGIEHIKVLQNTVAISGQQITVFGVQGQEVVLYDTNGRIVSQIIPQEDNLNITAPQIGAYILRVNNATKKIVVN